MNIIKTTALAFALLGTSSAFAADQCPDYLPTELMTDCIVETGAETSTDNHFDAEQKYKEWRQAQAKRLEALDDYTGTPIEPVAQNVIRNEML
jgi:hypothetical protein